VLQRDLQQTAVVGRIYKCQFVIRFQEILSSCARVLVIRNVECDAPQGVYQSNVFALSRRDTIKAQDQTGKGVVSATRPVNIWATNICSDHTGQIRFSKH
jgi:hypothetical protein